MEMELTALLIALSSYKYTITKILNEIDERIHQTLKAYSSGSNSAMKKFQISDKMVNLVKKYLDMINIGENVLEELLHVSSLVDPFRRLLNSTTVNSSLSDENGPEINLEPQISVDAGSQTENLGGCTIIDNASSVKPEIQQLEPENSQICDYLEVFDMFEKHENGNHHTEVGAQITKTQPPQGSHPKIRDSGGFTKSAGARCTTFKVLEEALYVNRDCNFAHIVTPSEFYLRVNQDLFEGLEKHLNANEEFQHVDKNYNNKYEAMACLGEFCLAFIACKGFRVEVLHWMLEDPEMVYVHFTDYGTKDYCSYRNLKPLTEKYAEYPRMAIKCYLAGVHPTASMWTKASRDCLLQLSEMEEKTRFKLIYVQKEGDSYAIDLWKDKDALSVGQTLVERGFAKHVTPAQTKD